MSKKNTVNTGSADIDSNVDNQGVTRRKAIKTAGVAGGLAAGGMWHKPLIESNVLPAHAALSAETRLLSGPASGLVPAGASTDGDSGETQIADTVMDSVFPKANAAGEPFTNALTFLGDPALTHCVTMSFPDGPGPFNPIEISVTGPTVYYSYFYYNSCEPRELPYSLTGEQTGQLMGPEGKDFNLNFGNFSVSGCITDDDFTGAEGSLIYNGGSLSQPGYGASGNFINIDVISGYGASFVITDGNSCSIGPGNFDITSGYCSYSG